VTHKLSVRLHTIEPGDFLEAKWIVGIDCAVDPQRTGAAVGVLSGEQLSLRRVRLCSSDCLPSSTAIEFVEDQRDVLFALDAPLGWPQALGVELRGHEAGGPLGTDADRLFRRDTDRFIKYHIGKQPLDVGADRIARAAVSALGILHATAAELGEQIKLAWRPTDRGRIAIEVYPAATLEALGIRSTRYKKPEQRTEREAIVDSLSKLMIIAEETREDLVASADVLDAAVCVLAGADFLLGRSLPPEDLPTAKMVGWIGVREPVNLKRPACNPAARADG
jgi:predicted RNase H-like nuclease